jgi:hypothetical protein
MTIGGVPLINKPWFIFIWGRHYLDMISGDIWLNLIMGPRRLHDGLMGTLWNCENRRIGKSLNGRTVEGCELVYR